MVKEFRIHEKREAYQYQRRRNREAKKSHKTINKCPWLIEITTQLHMDYQKKRVDNTNGRCREDRKENYPNP